MRWKVSDSCTEVTSVYLSLINTEKLKAPNVNPSPPPHATRGPAESNFLSVRHGPLGHLQSMKKQGLTACMAQARWCSHLPIFRVVSKTSPLDYEMAVKRMCLDCKGGRRLDVALCHKTDCPLHRCRPFRDIRQALGPGDRLDGPSDDGFQLFRCRVCESSKMKSPVNRGGCPGGPTDSTQNAHTTHITA
jgi:hypothetical protein